MSQAQVLRVAIRLLDSIGCVLAIGRVHPFRGDQQLGSAGPVGHDDVDLLDVVLAQNCCAGRGDAGDGFAAADPSGQLVTLPPGQTSQEFDDRHRQDSGMLGARPGRVVVETCPPQLVTEPYVESERRHTGPAVRPKHQRNTQQLDQCFEVGLIVRNTEIADDPGIRVVSTRRGITHDAVEDHPRSILRGRPSGHGSLAVCGAAPVRPALAE
jgi:hypothetical protein